MNGALLADAFDHHVWATLRLLDTCATLTSEQLAENVPGTFGPIIDTLRHLVSADCSYLELLSGGKVSRLADEETADVARLRAAIEANGPVWAELLAGDLDPAAVLIRHRDDGSSFHAPLTIRLAQVIHHGTDHRSQVCTALTNLGVAVPDIDVWDYAGTQGRAFEVPAPGQ